MDKIKCELSKLRVSKEPNKMIIEGCVTKVGSPSENAPCGSDGLPLAFSQESMTKSMKSWVNTPLNCTIPDGWDNSYFKYHGDTNIGVCRKVWMNGEDCMAEFVVWKDRFADVADMIVCGMESLGFSIECNILASHEEKDYLMVDDFEGTGCAILWKNCAAFESTYISKLAASRSDTEMTKEDKELLVKEIADAVMASIEEKFKAVDEKQETIMASVVEAKESQLKVEELSKAVAQTVVEEIKAQAEAAAKAVDEPQDTDVKAQAQDVSDDNADDDDKIDVKAQATIPVPTAIQASVANPNVTDEATLEDKIAKINASSMTMAQKIKEITKLRMSAKA